MEQASPTAWPCARYVELPHGGRTGGAQYDMGVTLLHRLARREQNAPVRVSHVDGSKRMGPQSERGGSKPAGDSSAIPLLIGLRLYGAVLRLSRRMCPKSQVLLPGSHIQQADSATRVASTCPRTHLCDHPARTAVPNKAEQAWSKQHATR